MVLLWGLGGEGGLTGRRVMQWQSPGASSQGQRGVANSLKGGKESKGRPCPSLMHFL